MSDEIVAMAERFHATYERLAPQFGYTTRLGTRVFDPESDNGRLMIATVKEVCADLIERQQRELAVVHQQSDEYRDAVIRCNREVVEARAECERRARLLRECAEFMAAHSEDCCIESAPLRQACELAIDKARHNNGGGA